MKEKAVSSHYSPSRLKVGDLVVCECGGGGFHYGRVLQARPGDFRVEWFVRTELSESTEGRKLRKTTLEELTMLLLAK